MIKPRKPRPRATTQYRDETTGQYISDEEGERTIADGNVMAHERSPVRSKREGVARFFQRFKNPRITMKNLKTKAVVQGTDFYFCQENEYRNLDSEAEKMILSFLAESGQMAKAHRGKGGEKADLTATLSATMDDAVQPDTVVNGLSRGDVRKFQRHALKFATKMVDFSETKDKKRGGKNTDE